MPPDSLSEAYGLYPVPEERRKKMNSIKNFVKVSGEKEFVDDIFEYLEKYSKYVFYDESPLKANLNDNGFHRFKDAQKRQG